jgi:hypothetical protein
MNSAEAIGNEMNQQTETPNKIYEVISHYKKAGAVVMDRFSTQPEALAFARDATDSIEPEAGDSLVSVTITNQAYEAECLDDDADG